MRYTFFLFILSIILFPEMSNSQEVLNIRPSVTNIYLKPSGIENNKLVSCLSSNNISAKYNDNSIQENIIEIQENLNDFLKTSVAPEILKIWLPFDSVNNQFSISVIAERGIYNATDNEYLFASFTKRGSSLLKDIGFELINHSYILVHEFQKMNLQHTGTGYDFTSSFYLHIYKIEWSNALENQVFNNWNDKGVLDKLDIQLTKLNTLSLNARAYTLTGKSKEKVLAELCKKVQLEIDKELALNSYTVTLEQIVDKNESTSENVNTYQDVAIIENSGIDKIISEDTQSKSFDADSVNDIGDTNIHTVSDETNNTENNIFRTKALVYKTWPIRAKIGTKEGLRNDQRYVVYEFVQNKNNGTVDEKQVGVVRVKEVADNEYISTGESASSKFYQTQGKKIETNMLLIEEPDKGIGGGVSIGTGLKIYIDAYITSLGLPNFPHGFKLYGNIYFPFYEKSIWNKSTVDIRPDVSSVGIAKNICFARNFAIMPYLGISSSLYSQKASGFGFDFGSRFTVAINPKTQVMTSIGFNSYLGDYYESPLDATIGLRFEF